MESAALIEWPEPLIELLGFVASFLAVGAVAFRAQVIRGALRSSNATASDRDVFERAARRAAALGAVGAVVSLGLFINRLPSMAARQHVSVGELLASRPQTQLQAALVLAALGGLALAAGRVRGAWSIAAIGVLVGPLTGAFFGAWPRLVVPIHKLAAGLWIGTLFMIVAVGIPIILRSSLAPARRGRMVADLVGAFSPLALAAAAVLAIFGVITSWQHLHTLRALWTTPYGVTLILKLVAVTAVLGLGAWNWRRQKPLLGSEAGAHALRRSATAELAAAAVVLAITSILVSVPSPKGPELPGPSSQPVPAEGASDSTLRR